MTQHSAEPEPKQPEFKINSVLKDFSANMKNYRKYTEKEKVLPAKSIQEKLEDYKKQAYKNELAKKFMTGKEKDNSFLKHGDEEMDISNISKGD